MKPPEASGAAPGRAAPARAARGGGERPEPQESAAPTPHRHRSASPLWPATDLGDQALELCRPNFPLHCGTAMALARGKASLCCGRESVRRCWWEKPKRRSRRLPANPSKLISEVELVAKQPCQDSQQPSVWGAPGHQRTQAGSSALIQSCQAIADRHRSWRRSPFSASLSISPPCSRNDKRILRRDAAMAQQPCLPQPSLLGLA